MRSVRRARASACAVLAVLIGSTVLGQTPFVDDARRSVTLPPNVTRVFAAGAPADVLLYTLVPQMLVGRNRPPAGAALEFFPEAYRSPVPVGRLPERDDSSGDAEMLSLRPDVFIDYGSTHEDYVQSVEAIERRTRVPAILLDGSMNRIPEVYRRLGGALGATDRGEQLAVASERLLARYRDTVARGASTVRVYLACSSDIAVPCVGKEGAGEQLAWLGAVNVTATAASPRKPLTVDEIRALSPDVVVVSGESTVARLRGDPQWRTVSAVASGRVHAWPELPFSWGSRPPSVNRLAGLIWLSRVLQAASFDAGFDAEVRAFFRTYYHVDLTDAQLRRLVLR